MRELWPHQITAIDLLWQALADGRKHPILMMATGAGKTKTAAEIIRRALAKGKRVVLTVPAIELIDQTVQALYAEGITDVAVIQAQHPLTNPDAQVQVASVQTLTRRMLPKADLVIVDEAHIAHKIVFRWMQEQERLFFIGLSATPWTKGLGKYYDALIIGATTRQLIRDGFLSDFKVFAPTHPDLTGVRTIAGDYAEDQLAEAMDKPKLVADVVATWLNLGENRPTLCFAVNRAHARSIQRDFEIAGVPVAYVDGDTPRGERDEIRRGFEAGTTKVVVNVGVLTTGVDWDVRCLILARPTKSEILFTQIIGRGLRRAVGKADCLILDHSDSTLNLGFVTDIHHDKLDDGKDRKVSSGARPEKSPKLPKECTSCHRLKPAGVHKCPSCGFAPERQTDIEPAQGELGRLGGKQIKADRDTKQKWWSMLLGHSEMKGYARGWAWHKYKDKFGVEPRGLDDSAATPDSQVSNWIRSTQIRWAKGKQKREAAEAHHA
jgi:superfamily II DNA or RNA helicase